MSISTNEKASDFSNEKIITDKDWLELSWNYFSLLSGQRMGMIDFYIVVEVESIVLSDVASEERGLSPFEKNFRWLQSLSNDVLIVLDNFDVLEENEPLFYNFINCGFTLLVTSHVHHESCCEIPIYEMQIDELRELFCHYYTKNELSNPQINDLIYAAHSHTMVVELMAKLMQNSPVSYDTLVSELRKSIAELALPVNVVLSKDGSTKNAIIRKHLEVLFDLSSLQDGELQTLIFMAYMPLDGVSETLFTKWADDVYGNSVTQLHRLGWIERHPENNISCMQILQGFSESVVMGCTRNLYYPSISNRWLNPICT